MVAASLWTLWRFNAERSLWDGVLAAEAADSRHCAVAALSLDP